MDLGELFDYINYITNKEQLGEPFSPKHYVLLLKLTNESYYESKYANVLDITQTEGTKINARLFQDSPLSHFLKEKVYDLNNTNITEFELPEDHGKTIDGGVYFSNIWKPADFVTIEEFNRRRFNVMSPTPRRKPYFAQSKDGYTFVPFATRKARVVYLRKAITPFFDYCVGKSDDNEYYMPPGSKIRDIRPVPLDDDDEIANPTSVGVSSPPLNEFNLYDKDNVLIKTNVIHLSSPTEYPYYSKSVELDWREDDKTKIGDMIIASATVRSRELNISQLATQSTAE